jgi:hypothetical protein
MKRTNIFKIVSVVFFTAIFTSCGPDYKKGQIVIDQYCLLNMEEQQAAEGAEKEAAVAKKQAFEKDVDEKYFKDTKMYQFILEGMKKCDEAGK